MRREIERKFRVCGDEWRGAAVEVIPIFQGYLCIDPERTVRVRIAGREAWITIKGRSCGPERAEYEYPIPAGDAEHLLHCVCLPGRIEKTRHRIPYAGLVFEVDEFHGANAGLVLAEVELPATETVIEKPAWLGEEVTGDSRFYNAYLSRYPYSTWK